MEHDADISQEHRELSAESLRQIGLRIMRERKERGWSQRELGRRTGISSTRLSRLERGRFAAQLGEILALCRVLGTDLAELIHGTSAIPPDSRLERLARRLQEERAPEEVTVIERLLAGFLREEEVR
jgi:transcriptional regulator with XRE-family HTH domain